MSRYGARGAHSACLFLVPGVHTHVYALSHTHTRARAQTLHTASVQIEEALEHVVVLFNYVADKDMFAEVHRNLLAKRLLNQRSASNDAERSIIGKLKYVDAARSARVHRTHVTNAPCTICPPCCAGCAVAHRSRARWRAC
ncbi:hypothetical protein EON67_03255 [archaeon]|nr:MAG: hypothetical protein EON67_03255 [archaeon]